MQSFIVGQRVIATQQIVEGIPPGNPDAKFPAHDYIHAEKRDEGVVEHVDHDGTPTVRFARTGTATIVRPHEVKPAKPVEHDMVGQLLALGRKVGREWCSWRLVRFVGTTRGGFVDVQSWTGAELNLFGMLAMMVVIRDYMRGPGMMTLSVYTRAGVVEAARIMIGRNRSAGSR